jgi:hypothetical protein
VGLAIRIITSVLLRGVVSKELSSNILFKGQKGFFLIREFIGLYLISSIILEELLYFRILLLGVLVLLSN